MLLSKGSPTILAPSFLLSLSFFGPGQGSGRTNEYEERKSARRQLCYISLSIILRERSRFGGWAKYAHGPLSRHLEMHAWKVPLTYSENCRLPPSSLSLPLLAHISSLAAIPSLTEMCLASSFAPHRSGVHANSFRCQMLESMSTLQAVVAPLTFYSISFWQHRPDGLASADAATTTTDFRNPVGERASELRKKARRLLVRSPTDRSPSRGTNERLLAATSNGEGSQGNVCSLLIFLERIHLQTFILQYVIRTQSGARIKLATRHPWRICPSWFLLISLLRSLLTTDFSLSLVFHPFTKAQFRRLEDSVAD